MTIYSQGGEQDAILTHVAGMEPGYILDVGACHPTTFSNSRALIERGWHATLVEASPDHFMTLYEEYREHPRVDLILAAAGTTWGLEVLHHTADLVSTTVDAHYEKWRGAAAFDGVFSVATVPLRYILGRGGPFDVISLDTEGTTPLLFRDALVHRPKVLCVEHDGDTSLEQAAVAAGYRRLYFDGNNVVLGR